MRIIEHNKFQEYVRLVLETFNPNREVSPVRDENLPIERAEFVELHKEKPGTVIFVRGRHAGADYRIKINDGDLEVWRNSDANGLRCPLESIVSWQGSAEGVKVEEGIIRAGSYTLMPYFSYDESKIKSESAMKPTDIWGDPYLLILVQRK